MRLIYTLFLLSLLNAAFAQSLYFPPAEGDDWATLQPDSLNWCPEKVDSLLAFVESRDTKAFIILKDGKIVLERYFGTFQQDSIWYWASAGKSLMAAVIGLAQEDGYLDINDPVSDYMGAGWTECPPEKEALITIRNQITMTTGLDDAVEDDATNSCFEPACFQYLVDAGTRWAYHNSPYRYTQELVEAATGVNLTLYTRLRLGNAIGMKGGWFGNVYYSKARDMARFGLLMLAEGQWGGTPVMIDTAYFNAMITPSQDLNQSYGYLWWLNGQPSFMLPATQLVLNGPMVPEAPADMYAALGKNDQKIYVIPSERLVVVRQGNNAGPVVAAASSFDNQLWARLSEMECLTAAAEVEPRPDWTIAPNPTTDEIRVMGKADIAHLELLNSSGVVVRNVADQRMDVAGLVPGIYFLRIWTTKGLSGTERIVIH
ncbi:serine hydrolase [Phaeodactylibacter xiamenensis]|uniref:serine hydrolase n=1 Tax=Phaeodactylibacter xiamenensis TaxID=1524460 RepID=UPI003BAC681A